jgi:hypothetical protein
MDGKKVTFGAIQNMCKNRVARHVGGKEDGRHRVNGIRKLDRRERKIRKIDVQIGDT